MMKLGSTFLELAESWRRRDRGSVAIIFALAMPIVAAGAALGLEVGVWYYDKLKLQQAADAAAYAAAVDNREGSSASVMTTDATTAATTDGFNSATDTLTLHTPPTSGSSINANSDEVYITRTETRYFSAIFTSTPVQVTVRAVATYTTAANACILALDPSASQAVYFNGSSTVKLSGCDVMADSISTSSVYSQGSTTVSVPCIMTAGGVSLNAYVSQTSCKSPMTNLAPVVDPFKSVAAPDYTSMSCQSTSGKKLKPGRYCGGLALNGTVQLDPGTYIIDSGSLTANGSAVVTGNGVTFYLDNNASLTFNGNASLNLSAPTSGTYSGMLFFGSRSPCGSSTSCTPSTVKLNGTAGSVMTGAIYFPGQPVSYLGDMVGSNGCTQVVAKTIAWSGNANLAADCTAYGMSALQVGGVVKLVE